MAGNAERDWHGGGSPGCNGECGSRRVSSTHIAFESGAAVHEGDLLVQLDTKQEQAQLAQQQARLAAVEAARELARLNFERMQGLVNEGAITRAEYDRGCSPAEANRSRADTNRGTD